MPSAFSAPPVPISGAHCHEHWQPHCCQRGLTWFWNSVEMPHTWSIVENNSGLNLGGKRSGRTNHTAAWGCHIGWAGNKATSHLTGDLLNEKARWALISLSIFLGLWKSVWMLKKDQRGPQLSTHPWLNVRLENESGAHCKSPPYSMCTSTYT